MFEKIIIRKSDSGADIDAGALAETLLFYGKVHLVVSGNEFTRFALRVGADCIFDLIDANLLDVSLVRDMHATTTTTVAGAQFLRLNTIEICGFEKRVLSNEEAAYLWLRAPKINLTEWQKKRFVKKLLRATKITNYTKMCPGIVDGSTSDIKDHTFAASAAKLIVRNRCKNYDTNGLVFHVHDAGCGDLFVESNIDFERIKSFDATIDSNAHILNCILEARADMAIAASYMSEMATSQEASDLISLKLSSILERRKFNGLQISEFLKYTHIESRAVRDAVNAESPTFADFSKFLIKRSGKFKQWTASLHPDENILAEYIASATSETWINKLPAKIARFALFTGGGLALDPIIGSSLGVALSVADTFLLEKMFKGWKPSQFVDGELSPILARNKRS